MSIDISSNTLISVCFALFSAVLVVVLQRQTERLKIIESQLSQSKYRVYHELVSLFFDMLKDTKAKRALDIPILTNRMLDIKKDLLIYGSDDVVKLLSKWLVYTSINPDSADHIWIYVDMIIKVRKDMADRRTSISRDDIMLLIMQNEEEYNQLKSSLLA